jgi:hypothetical protein
MNIHALSGIQTRDSGKQTAADLRFKPHGYWHRPYSVLPNYIS